MLKNEMKNKNAIGTSDIDFQTVERLKNAQSISSKDFGIEPNVDKIKASRGFL